jgi:uncharacterized repeat protein (TIGR03803 family)
VTFAGAEKVLHSFGSGTDGNEPDSGLIDAGGTLYGTTAFGGTNIGTVYKITPAGAEAVLYSVGELGTFPGGNLLNAGGTFYGATFAGGSFSMPCPAWGCGTVFKVTKAGAGALLYSFGGSDGQEPNGGLIEVGGKLYGTTTYGGTTGDGTVFDVTFAGAEKVLHVFGTGSDGGNPTAGLINVGGTLYGTTETGGTFGDGTVFSITLGGMETVLYSFGANGQADGSAPGGLINVGGVLYGTTSSGGSGGSGTVFAVTP